jgi:hypothetical protein
MTEAFQKRTWGFPDRQMEGYESESALKGAACAFLNSYFAFGTFVGI